MRRVSPMHNIGRVSIGKKVFTSMNTSVKRSMLAILLALTFCAMAPLFNGVQANSCGNLSLFAFPMSPKQGDQVSLFVSVTNTTNADASYVVDTKISDPTSALVGSDDRVVAVPAGSSVSFAITFSSSQSNKTGTYTVVTQSYQGSSLPVCTTCFCSSTRMQFSLACNSNEC